MNGLDFALIVVLVGCALRGYWRGFFREGFGLLALIAGIAAAVEGAAPASALVQQHVTLPSPLPTGVAFVAIFVAVHSAVNIVGVVIDRLVGGSLLRGVSRFVGALLSVGKAAFALAFVLLFLHLLPLMPRLDGQIMQSSIARPLVVAASNVLRTGPQPTAQDSPKA